MLNHKVAAPGNSRREPVLVTFRLYATCTNCSIPFPIHWIVKIVNSSCNWVVSSSFAFSRISEAIIAVTFMPATAESNCAYGLSVMQWSRVIAKRCYALSGKALLTLFPSFSGSRRGSESSSVFGRISDFPPDLDNNRNHRDEVFSDGEQNWSLMMITMMSKMSCCVVRLIETGCHI